MFEDEEDEDKVVKIELPKYTVFYSDINPNKLINVLECIYTWLLIFYYL